MAHNRSGLPRPKPGGPEVSYESTVAFTKSEKTMNWPKAPGPKGKSLNRTGWPEVKAYAAQDLADDKYLHQRGFKRKRR